MRIRSVVILLASLGLIVFASTRAFSEDEKPAGGMPEMSPEMMKKMQECMKNMQPSDAHKLLTERAGSWKVTMKMWMMGEGSGPPMISEGTSEVKSILGGRYVSEDFHCSMMMPDEKGGMSKVPYEGTGLTGYDNDRKVYFGNWANNLGTAMLTFKGSVSQDGKTLTMYGEMDEPMMGIYGRYVRYVTKTISKDKHVFSVYDLHAGDNYKVFEIDYERK
ncbi:MAG: DUF1579 family protein [Planctomycetes bacterium]|nr:DUF1579 family protein [Planctomycetota bacterium]